MRIDLNIEASALETDDVQYTGPLGGWPFPLVNIFLVDDNRISEATELLEEVNQASEVNRQD